MGENRPEENLPNYIKLKSETGEECIHYSTGCKEMSEEIKQYAERELNETPENKEKGLVKLKIFMSKEKMPHIEDDILVAVLRCSKYNMKKAESKLKKFCKLRSMIVKNIKKTDMEKFEHMVDDGISDCLPFADKHGRPIYFARLNMNLDLYNYDDVAVYLQAAAIPILSYPLSTTKGVVFILDCQSQSPSIYFSLLKSYRQYLGIEKTVPLRIARIDIVNENVLVQYVYAIIRPFMPSKIVERIAFHGSDFKSLHKVYHPDILPEELGGTMGPTNTKLFREVKLNAIRLLKSENNE